MEEEEDWGDCNVLVIQSWGVGHPCYIKVCVCGAPETVVLGHLRKIQGAVMFRMLLATFRTSLQKQRQA